MAWEDGLPSEPLGFARKPLWLQILNAIDTWQNKLRMAAESKASRQGSCATLHETSYHPLHLQLGPQRTFMHIQPVNNTLHIGQQSHAVPGLARQRLHRCEASTACNTPQVGCLSTLEISDPMGSL